MKFRDHMPAEELFAALLEVPADASARESLWAYFAEVGQNIAGELCWTGERVEAKLGGEVLIESCSLVTAAAALQMAIEASARTHDRVWLAAATDARHVAVPVDPEVLSRIAAGDGARLVIRDSIGWRRWIP